MVNIIALILVLLIPAILWGCIIYWLLIRK